MVTAFALAGRGRCCWRLQLAAKCSRSGTTGVRLPTEPVPDHISNVSHHMHRLILLAATAGLVGCDGPYGDLEKSFRSPQAASAPSLPLGRVVLTSTKHVGASSFDEVLLVKLLPVAIELEPRGPFSIGMSTVQISAETVAGCSQTCFGDGNWDADLLIASTGTEISFRNTKPIVEWCWSNRIPMISGKDKRAWLYAGGELPDRSKFAEQLSSRELYDKQARQSCLGY